MHTNLPHTEVLCSVRPWQLHSASLNMCKFIACLASVLHVRFCACMLVDSASVNLPLFNYAKSEIHAFLQAFNHLLNHLLMHPFSQWLTYSLVHSRNHSSHHTSCNNAIRAGVASGVVLHDLQVMPDRSKAHVVVKKLAYLSR